MARLVWDVKVKDPKFYYRMRALRKACGITQEELGDLLGMSNAFVSMYERGLVDTTVYDNDINAILHDIRDRLVKKYGYWYDSYLELKTSMNLMEIYIQFEGQAPVEVIQRVKDCSVGFANI